MTVSIRQLLLTAYPAGHGPYERWELTVEATSQTLASGACPVDHAVVQAACESYHAGLDAMEATS